MFRSDFGYLTPPCSPRRTNDEENEIARLENEIRNRSLSREERKTARSELFLKLYGCPDFDSPRTSEMTETDDECIPYDDSSSDESSSDEDEIESPYFQAEVDDGQYQLQEPLKLTKLK